VCSEGAADHSDSVATDAGLSAPAGRSPKSTGHGCTTAQDWARDPCWT
jgi:hypothetical protein